MESFHINGNFINKRVKLSIYIEVFDPKLFKLGALPEMNNIYDENHLAKEAVFIAHDADSDSR